MRYIGVGGHHDAFAIRHYLGGHRTFSDVDHDHLALALNEAYVDAGDGRPPRYRYT